MKNFSIYCKSYKTDLNRAKRLALSIAKYNEEKIDFFLSCPSQEIPLFKNALGDLDVNLIADEDIIRSNPSHKIEHINKIPGNLAQQIIKSEFWRVGYSNCYLCVDSDSKFIRPFKKEDFLFEPNIPYTIIDECREILVPAIAAKKQKIINDFHREAHNVQKKIDRPGKYYNFGPNNPVWHKDVWQSLSEYFLIPNHISLAELIVEYPIEMRWYGEALLKYKAIPLLPSQPFFKMYAYAWQLKKDLSDGIQEVNLAQLYNGVTYQSAWERELDWPNEGGSMPSRLARKLRRIFGHT